MTINPRESGRRRYVENPIVYTSTASQNPAHNEPKGILMNPDADAERIFHRAKRLEPDLLEDNRFYVVSITTMKFYEITQEEFYISPWEIFGPINPVFTPSGDRFYRDSKGKWHKLMDIDEYGEYAVSPGVDSVEQN